VNQLGNPKFSTIDIRGYGEAAASNVLFLIDGRRINNVDITGADLAQIPVEAIERIEIYRGPATVMFGDNAAAGAINIILRRGKGPLTAQATVTGGSNRLFQPAVNLSGSYDNLSYFLMASLNQTDGYRHNNSLSTRDVFGSFILGDETRASLYLKAGYHNDGYGMPGPLLWQELPLGVLDPKDSLQPYNNGSTEDSFFDAEARLSPLDGLLLSVGGSYRKRHTASWFQGSFGGMRWYNQSMAVLETYAFTPKVIFDRPVFSLKSSFVAGFDYYHYPTSVDWSGGFGGYPSHTLASITKTDYGLYANEKLFVTDQVQLEAGYRRQKASYDSDYRNYVPPPSLQNVTDTWWQDAFRFSLNYLFGGNGNLFITYAKGFRFPTTDEMINVQTGAVNTRIRPQITKEIDVGGRWNPLPYLGGSVTLFEIRNNDEIYYNPFTFANANYDRTLRRGLEATARLLPADGLQFDLSYSLVRAQFDGGPFDGNEVPFVPESKIAGSGKYTWNGFGFYAGAVYTGSRYAISDQANTHRTVPGYTTADANISYAMKSWFFQIGVRNLFDKQFYEYAVASAFSPRVNVYPAPGRQYFFTVRYTYDS
jgi:iron complex outermembrane receptor protein